MTYQSTTLWTRYRASHGYLPLVLVALTIVGACQAAHAVTFTKIALTGETAPGTTAAFSTQGIGLLLTDVTLNDAGQVSFHATLDPTDSHLPLEGIWTGAPGNLQAVAIEDDPVLGSPNGVPIRISSLASPIPLNDNGQIAFTASVQDSPSTGLSSLWRGTPGNLDNFALAGTQAPGGEPGLAFDWFVRAKPAHQNAQGDVAFQAATAKQDGSAIDTNGIWVATNSGILPVVISGHPDPGKPAGTMFSGGNLQGLNDNGQVVFNGLNGSAASSQGLWIGTAPNNLRPIIEPDASLPVINPDTSPGTTTAPTQMSYGAVLNNAGQVVFSARNTDGKAGLWLDDSGTVSFIAMEGAPAPDAPAGSLFNSFNTKITQTDGLTDRGFNFNEAGDIAFKATVDVPTTSGPQTLDGIWAGRPDDLKLIALQGQPTSALGGGTPFGYLSDPLLNDLGQVVFTTDTGLWLADPLQGLTRLVEAGDLIDLGLGDTRTIRDLVPRDLNNNSQLSANVFFTDGASGVFVINVPEPATGMMLLLVIAGASTRPRSRV